MFLSPRLLGLIDLLKCKHSITFLRTSIFTVVCYCLMNPERVRIEALCLLLSMFWSVLEGQSRKLFAQLVNNWFYSIVRFIVLCLGPALVLVFCLSFFFLLPFSLCNPSNFSPLQLSVFVHVCLSVCLNVSL